MDRAVRRDDPLEVISRVRSASIVLGASGTSGFVDPGGPLRGAHVRAAQPELEQRGRATFFAERWATQPIAARARTIWRGWATSFAGSLSWESRGTNDLTPRMREQLAELNTLLGGPATRGELRVLDAYEAYFETLFTLGWAVVVRVDPLGDARRLTSVAGSGGASSDAAVRAWREIQGAWIAPWDGRRRHGELFDALLGWVDPPAPRRLVDRSSTASDVAPQNPPFDVRRAQPAAPNVTVTPGGAR